MGFSYQTLKTREAKNAFRIEYYPEAFRSALSLTHSRSEAEELVDALFKRMNTRYQVVPLPVNVNLQLLSQLNLLYARGNYSSSAHESADEAAAEEIPEKTAETPVKRTAEPAADIPRKRRTSICTNLTDEDDYSAYMPNDFIKPARLKPIIKMNMPASRQAAAQRTAPPLTPSVPLVIASQPAASAKIQTVPISQPQTQPAVPEHGQPAAQMQTVPIQPQTQPAAPEQAQPAAQMQTVSVQPQTQPATPEQAQPAVQMQTVPVSQPQLNGFIQPGIAPYPAAAPMAQGIPYGWQAAMPYGQPMYVPTAPVVVMPDLSGYQKASAPPDAPAPQKEAPEPPEKKVIRRECYNPKLTELWTPAKEAAEIAAAPGGASWLSAPSPIPPAEDELIDIPEADDSDFDDESNKRSVPLTIFNTFLFIGVIFSIIYLLMQLKVLPKLF